MPVDKFLIQSYFLSECSKDGECINDKKGKCDSDTNTCKCDADFHPKEDDNSCVGMLYLF